jgi:hypothetical protein
LATKIIIRPQASNDDFTKGELAMQYKNATVALALMFTCTIALYGQSLSDLANKAKKKIADSVTQPSNVSKPGSNTNSPVESPASAPTTAATNSSANTTTAAAKAQPAVAQPQSVQDLSQYETHGPLLYTYCFSNANIPGKAPTTYVSDIFQIHGPDTGMTTTSYRQKLFPHYADPFKTYVDVKFGAPTRYQDSFGCPDGFKTADLAQADKTRYHSVPSPNPYHITIVETNWKGDNGVLTNQELNPQNRHDVDLQRAIAQEHDRFAPTCTANAWMSGNLDCSCYSEHMYQARLNSTNTIPAAGGQIHPLIRELFPTAHLDACTSRDRITSYSEKQIDKMSSSSSDKAALKACVPSALATMVMANPNSLSEISIYNGLNMQAMMKCSSNR